MTVRQKVPQNIVEVIFGRGKVINRPAHCPDRQDSTLSWKKGVGGAGGEDAQVRLIWSKRRAGKKRKGSLCLFFFFWFMFCIFNSLKTKIKRPVRSSSVRFAELRDWLRQTTRGGIISTILTTCVPSRFRSVALGLRKHQVRNSSTLRFEVNTESVHV